MFSAALFLGFSVNSDLERRLAAVSPELTSIFIDNQSDYLHECQYGAARYLGKFVEAPFDLARVELVQANIESVLRRLDVNFLAHCGPMQLVAVSQTEPSLAT